MFDVQAGSLIVESLRTYRQPVMIYLGPGAELRGGAWVVVDGQINAEQVQLVHDHEDYTCQARAPALCAHAISRLRQVQESERLFTGQITCGSPLLYEQYQAVSLVPNLQQKNLP